MLIIFDLDDTLIQTSKLITPWRFQRVLSHLSTQAYVNISLQKMYDEILANHQQFETSTDAIRHYFDFFGIAPHFCDASVQLMNEFDLQIPVEVFHGVPQLLKNLKNNFKVACVTAGSKDIQELKIKKAFLDEGYFDAVLIVEQGDKTSAYKQLQDHYQSETVIVVGDRVKKDLIPAKALGFCTVLVQQGRGQFQKFNKEFVDFVIQDVTEVENLIKFIKNK